MVLAGYQLRVVYSLIVYYAQHFANNIFYICIANSSIAVKRNTLQQSRHRAASQVLYTWHGMAATNYRNMSSSSSSMSVGSVSTPTLYFATTTRVCMCQVLTLLNIYRVFHIYETILKAKPTPFPRAESRVNLVS